jgi:hypothetical protein
VRIDAKLAWGDDRHTGESCRAHEPVAGEDPTLIAHY